MATTNGVNGASHSNGINGSSKTAHVSVDEFLQTSYDYVICGGGTAGLTIAARLTENPDVTVGVIEAGKNRLGDPLVDTPAAFPQMLGNREYDWAYDTVPQKGNKNIVHQVPRGKLLGGSSGINYMMYVRGSDQDYDDWAEMSNDPQWSSAALKQYMRKHQTLEPIDPRVTDRTCHPFVGEHHGTSGPVRTSFNDPSAKLPIEDDIIKAADQAAGLTKKPIDPWSGDHIGFFNTLGAVARTGPNKGKRSYAARGYYQANEHRPNLKVITESLVARVILEDATATGVEFVHGGQKHSVKAKREVIVCGGTINSPQILELSGIGDPEILKAAGVDVKIDLPSVGTNYQDHVITSTKYQLAPGQISGDIIFNPDVMGAAQKQLVEEQAGALTNISAVQGFFPVAPVLEEGELDEIVKSIQDTKPANDFQKKQWDQVIAHLKSPKSANLQLVLINMSADLINGVGDQSKLYLPPSSPDAPFGFVLVVCSQYPVARGTIHITSSDPAVHPAVDPNYLGHPADVAVLGAGLKFMEKMVASPALQDKVAARLHPPTDKFPSLATVQERRAASEEYCLGEYHSCGSCAMGSTVDSRLKVYGVNRLRVADASVFANNVSGNIVSSVYMVAEKAADLIKEDWDRAALKTQ